MEKQQVQKNDEEIVIDLWQLLKALWKHIIAIILVTVLFGGAGFSFAKFLVTPTYQASALMYVNNSSISVGSTSVSLSDLSASQSLVDTYIVILKTRLTLNEVIRQAGLTYTYEDLSKMIDAQAVNKTEIFRINVTSTSPYEAEKIANTIVDVLPSKISEVMDGSSVRTVDFAVVPERKFAPSITKYTAIGLLAGLVVSCLVVIVLELLDQQIRDEEYLLKTYNIPVLAVIPDLMNPTAGSGKYGKYGKYEKYGYYAQKDGEGA